VLKMGKYRASLIHEWFSDWHIVKCGPNAYLCDADRLWIETRNYKVVCVFELKWAWSCELELDALMVSEQIIMKFFEENKVPFYVVIIEVRKGPSPIFEIHRPFTKFQINLTESEMVEWIKDHDLNFEFLENKQKLLEVARYV